MLETSIRAEAAAARAGVAGPSPAAGGMLQCDAGHTFPWTTRADVCPQCGALLQWEPTRPERVGRAGAEEGPHAWGVRQSGVWRHGPWIWPGPAAQIVSLQEGRGALHPLHPRLASRVPEVRVWFQHEGENPTSSFKDRGMTVAVTAAAAQEAHTLVCASTGNTSSSLAAYAAAAGLRAVVLVPSGKISAAKLAQTLAHGAHVVALDGSFDLCMRVSRDLTAGIAGPGVRVVNSLSPWRLAGQGTIALSLIAHLREATGGDLPAWIVLPGGNLGNVSAIGQMLLRAQAWGWIPTVPRLAVVQAAGAAPFAAWAARHWTDWAPVEAPETIATAIRIGDPVSRERAARVLRATDGVALEVPDAALVEAQRDLALTGLGCEPASAASWAGIQLLQQRGLLSAGQQVVGILTGHLLKDPSPLIDLSPSPRGAIRQGRLTETTREALLTWLSRPPAS